jgi:hypothetical protein
MVSSKESICSQSRGDKIGTVFARAAELDGWAWRISESGAVGAEGEIGVEWGLDRWRRCVFDSVPARAPLWRVSFDFPHAVLCTAAKCND